MFVFDEEWEIMDLREKFSTKRDKTRVYQTLIDSAKRKFCYIINAWMKTLTSKSTDKISRRYITMKLNEFVDYLKVLFEDEFVAKIEKNETDLLLTFLDGKQVKVSVSE